MSVIPLSFLIVCLILLFSDASYAAHILGGELTYTCNENDSYDFSLTLYRDCAGEIACFDSQVSACPSTLDATVTIYRDDVLYQSIVLDEPIVDDITDLMQIPDIGIPLIACIDRGTYQFSLSLPMGSSYNIVYQRCCLAADLGNIQNSLEFGLTFNQETPANISCNSSSAFTQVPQHFAVLGTSFDFDYSAIDPDGDSLHYQLCNAFAGGGGSTIFPFSAEGIAPDPDTNGPYDVIPYLPSFSSENPFPSENGIMLDSQSGILSGEPTAVGKYLLSVCVEEYRDGVQIGIIRRVFQLQVIPGPVSNQEVLPYDDIEVWPNPTSTYLNIGSPEDPQDKELSVFDLSGKLVKRLRFFGHQTRIDELKPGVYLLQIETSNQLTRKKIIIL